MMDRKGILSLPIKLAVSFLIIGLSLPPLMALAEDVNDGAELSELEESAADLKRAMAGAYYSGSGNSRSFQLDVPAGGVLCIGGDGPLKYSIRLYMNGEHRGNVFLDNPVFPVIGEERELSGTCYLVLSGCVTGDGADRRLGVEVVDA